MTRRALLIVFICAVAAVPLTSYAQQQARVFRIGFLSPSSAIIGAETSDAFLRGMGELGYIPGNNLVVEWRFADGKSERLPELAAELVQSKVAVIVATGSPAIGAAQRATTTIPIVMATTGDPVGGGFVKSLARPGGNITGLSNMGGEVGPKLLDLLLSVVPKLSRVGVLVTLTSSTYKAIAEGVQGAAQKAGVKAIVFEASTPQEIENAFLAMDRENVGAVIVGAAPFFTLQQRQIAELAVKYRLPSMFGNRAIVDAGGLISYAQNRTESYFRSATYVDKILRGAKPADLPVEQPTRFELVVNLRTAKAIGLAIPHSILLRADEVIQ